MLAPLPLQTAYQQYENVGQVGMPATTGDHVVDNRILDDPANVGCGFGLAVCQGYTSDKAITLGQASGGIFVGITRADQTLPRFDLTPPRVVDTFYAGDNVGVHVRGDIWVKPATNVNSGDPIYFNSVTGQLGNSGISNAVNIKNSRWETSLPRPSGELVSYAGLAVARLGASAQ
jgi:hypothetical protein